MFSLLKKSIERCDRLQGIQLIGSVNGGTGAAAAPLIVRGLKEEGIITDKCPIIGYFISPTKYYVSTSRQPINSYYALSELHQDLSMAVLVENEQVGWQLDVGCFEHKGLGQYLYEATYYESGMRLMNEIIATSYAGITSCLRFGCEEALGLNGNLRSLQHLAQSVVLNE